MNSRVRICSLGLFLLVGAPLAAQAAGLGVGGSGGASVGGASVGAATGMRAGGIGIGAGSYVGGAAGVSAPSGGLSTAASGSSDDSLDMRGKKIDAASAATGDAGPDHADAKADAQAGR